ncbi:MAG: hypothetical protein Q8L55_12690 [Phycisphaerales bacterium]|nr:hypothetical protein [Phycisphaerales bacterium]
MYSTMHFTQATTQSAAAHFAPHAVATAQRRRGPVGLRQGTSHPSHAPHAESGHDGIRAVL